MRQVVSLLIVVSFAISTGVGCSDDTSAARSNNFNNGSDAGTNNDVDMGGRTPCDSNADCTAPEVCVVDLQAGGAFCEDPSGQGEVGDMCSDGNECQSGLCLNGQCAAPCGSEADCPAGYACESSQIPLDGGGTATLNVCVPEGTPCLRDGDCTDPDACIVDRAGDGVVLQCGGTVGTTAIGGACTQDADCANNLCLNDVCTKPCRAPNDCAMDGSFVCDTATVSTGGADVDVNVCQPRPADVCLSDSDCTNPERCVAITTATDVEFKCDTPNAGGGETGATCTANTDCAQNLCVEGVCAGPCEGTGDCSVAPDFTCEVTSVDLGGGASDTAQICAPPTPCAENDDCSAPDVCYFRPDGNNGFDQFCRAPNVGGGGLGQVCTTAQECGPNACLETRFRDVCTVGCVDNTDCTLPGYECQDTTIDGASARACAPSTPPPCTSNDQCATQTTCAIIPNVAGNALESVCVPETGGDATGTMCTSDDDCNSLVCVNGACAAPCVDSNQCGAGQICRSNLITKTPASGTFDVCETLLEQTCVDTDSCSDPVRVCSNLVDVSDVATAFCAFPSTTGTAMLGDTCTAGTECRENICLNASNTCSVVCNDDTDCGANQGCTTYPLVLNGTRTNLGFCNGVCSDNSDCANGNICTINSDFIADDVDQVCEAAVGAKDLGETCTNGGECVEGLCLRTLLYNGTTCTTAANCSTGEVCECPINDPNCAPAVKECATESFACTRLCDDPTDCVSSFSGNAMTACSPDTSVSRPVSGTAKSISTCARP